MFHSQQSCGAGQCSPYFTGKGISAVLALDHCILHQCNCSIIFRLRNIENKEMSFPMSLFGTFDWDPEIQPWPPHLHILWASDHMIPSQCPILRTLSPFFDLKLYSDYSWESQLHWSFTLLSLVKCGKFLSSGKVLWEVLPPRETAY